MWGREIGMRAEPTRSYSWGEREEEGMATQTAPTDTRAEPEQETPAPEPLEFREARTLLESLLSGCTTEERHRVADRARDWLDVECPPTADAEQLAPALAYRLTEPEVPVEARTGGGLRRFVELYREPSEWMELALEIRDAVEEGRLGRGTCRYCGREVLWAKTDNGQNIPLDPRPKSWEEGGRFLFRDGEGEQAVVSWAPKLRDDVPGPDEYGLRCHMESCPEEERPEES